MNKIIMSIRVRGVEEQRGDLGLPPVLGEWRPPRHGQRQALATTGHLLLLESEYFLELLFMMLLLLLLLSFQSSIGGVAWGA